MRSNRFGDENNIADPGPDARPGARQYVANRSGNNSAQDNSDSTRQWQLQGAQGTPPNRLQNRLIRPDDNRSWRERQEFYNPEGRDGNQETNLQERPRCMPNSTMYDGPVQRQQSREMPERPVSNAVTRENRNKQEQTALPVGYYKKNESRNTDRSNYELSLPNEETPQCTDEERKKETDTIEIIHDWLCNNGRMNVLDLYDSYRNEMEHHGNTNWINSLSEFEDFLALRSHIFLIKGNGKVQCRSFGYRKYFPAVICIIHKFGSAGADFKSVYFSLKDLPFGNGKVSRRPNIWNGKLSNRRFMEFCSKHPRIFKITDESGRGLDSKISVTEEALRVPALWDSRISCKLRGGRVMPDKTTNMLLHGKLISVVKKHGKFTTYASTFIDMAMFVESRVATPKCLENGMLFKEAFTLNEDVAVHVMPAGNNDFLTTRLASIGKINIFELDYKEVNDENLHKGDSHDLLDRAFAVEAEKETIAQFDKLIGEEPVYLRDIQEKAQTLCVRDLNNINGLMKFFQDRPHLFNLGDDETGETVVSSLDEENRKTITELLKLLNKGCTEVELKRRFALHPLEGGIEMFLKRLDKLLLRTGEIEEKSSIRYILLPLFDEDEELLLPDFKENANAPIRIEDLQYDYFWNDV